MKKVSGTCDYGKHSTMWHLFESERSPFLSAQLCQQSTLHVFPNISYYLTSTLACAHLHCSFGFQDGGCFSTPLAVEHTLLYSWATHRIHHLLPLSFLLSLILTASSRLNCNFPELSQKLKSVNSNSILVPSLPLHSLQLFVLSKSIEPLIFPTFLPFPILLPDQVYSVITSVVCAPTVMETNCFLLAWTTSIQCSPGKYSTQGIKELTAGTLGSQNEELFSELHTQAPLEHCNYVN